LRFCRIFERDFAAPALQHIRKKVYFMQKILTLLAFLCLTLPALNAQTARRVEVLFSNTHTQSDLMNIQAELGAQKIKLDYTRTAFDASGHLVEIAFTVEFPDGVKGSAETSHVPSADEPKFGFMHDPRPGAKGAVQAGELTE
jgi:hypothetical protein